jgi:hypothetical protein
MASCTAVPRPERRGVVRRGRPILLLAAVLAGVLLLAAACSSTPDATGPTPIGTTAAPIDDDPGLASLPMLDVTITADAGRAAVRVADHAPVGAGLVRLVVRNDARADPSGTGRGVVVVDVAPAASRADLEAALVSGPERVDGLAVYLGGAAPLASGATQEVVVSLAAGHHYLAPTGPGPLGTVASSRIQAAPIEALDVAPGSSEPTGTGISGSTVPAPVLTAPPGSTPATPLGTVPLGTVAPAPVAPTQGDVVSRLRAGDITLSDYDVDLPDEVRAGWYHVTNRGPQPHELAIIAVDEGHEGADVIDALEHRALADRPTVGTTPPGSTPGSVPDATTTTAGPDAAAGGSDVHASWHGGLASLSPGAEAWVPLDLGSGGYLAICDRPALLADAGQSAADDLPHHTHGMAVFFRVA